MMYNQEWYDSIEFTPIYSRDGIGSYEFWGFRAYDEGQRYIDDLEWDSLKYTPYENKLIEQYIYDNFDLICKERF